MHVPLCFSSPFSRLPNKTRTAKPRTALVCVLENPTTQPPPVATPANPAIPHAHPVTKEQDTKNPKYHVLPQDLPKEHLPPAPPVHRSVPFFGYILESMFNLSSPIGRAKRYGGIYNSDFLIRDMNFITDTGSMVNMIRNADIFRSAGSSTVLEAVFSKDSMILLDGPDHAMARGVLAPAFSAKLFPFYLDIIRAQVDKSWAGVQKAVAKEGKVLLDPTFRNQYLSIIVKLSTGIDMDSEYANAIRRRFLLLQRGFFSPSFGPIWDTAMRSKREVLDILEKVILENLVQKADTIESLRAYGDKLSHEGSKDIIKGEVNMLLIVMAFSDLKTGKGQKNNPRTIQRLCTLVLGLWFAGYATTAATSSSAVFQLGLETSIWDPLQAEQDRIVAEAGSKEVTYGQIISDMPLLDSYISEIMRLYPSAIGVTRKVSKDIEVLGHYLKAGSVVFFDFLSAMRDERMYDDPDTLKVDRFVKEKGKMSVPRILTFGAPGSPHFCLGAALAGVLMKTTFSVLLREYKMELDPNQSREYTLVPEIVPKSKVVVRGFEKRSQ